MHVRRPASLALASIAVIAGCGGAGPAAPAPGPAATPVVATPVPASPSPDPTESPGPTDEEVAWVVYQSPDGLRLIHPVTGTSRRVLPDGPAGALHPDWSPDGSRLAFAVDDRDGTRDIWTSGWDGSSPRLLVDCGVPCRDADSPAWSPDGTRIAFNRMDNIDGHNPGSELQVVDVATGTIETIASTTGADYLIAPRWSPDGRSIVVQVDRYVDDGNDTEEIIGRAIGVVDLDDTDPSIRVIRDLESFAYYPDWHPTEDLILFGEGARDPLDPSEPPANVFTMRPDGTGVAQLTKQAGADDGIWMAAFRPDGTGIVATRVHYDGALTLVSLASDGSGLADLDSHGPTSGAHSRQRPVPQP